MANENEERIIMEIETRLEEDNEGTFKSGVAAGIDEQIAAVNAALTKGVAPAEYEKLNALKTGLVSASLVLENTWSFYHR